MGVSQYPTHFNHLGIFEKKNPPVGTIFRDSDVIGSEQPLDVSTCFKLSPKLKSHQD